MATPTPWQLTARKRARVKKVETYTYDPYNFSHETTSSGTNPVMRVSMSGPNAAGAPFPRSVPKVASTEYLPVDPAVKPDYGDNTGKQGK